MIDMHAPIALRELEREGSLRTRQLLARGANLHAIFSLAANREITVSGSDERARISWALAPGEG